MKLLKYIVVIVAIPLTFLSCENYAMQVDKPTFDVQVDATEYEAGQAVVFTLSGHADYINFYSGEGLEGKDKPKVVKKYSDSPKTSFSYTFAQPGTYEVVFVATNATIEHSKEVIREITLVINP